MATAATALLRWSGGDNGVTGFIDGRLDLVAREAALHRNSAGVEIDVDARTRITALQGRGNGAHAVLAGHAMDGELHVWLRSKPACRRRVQAPACHGGKVKTPFFSSVGLLGSPAMASVHAPR